MKICICDNDSFTNREIRSLLENFAESEEGFDVSDFSCGEDLLEYYNSGNGFDIVFLDPPYNKGYINPIIKAILSSDILSPDGIIVLESDNTDEHGDFDTLEILKQRKYGRTYITVYQRGDKR